MKEKRKKVWRRTEAILLTVILSFTAIPQIEMGKVRASEKTKLYNPRIARDSSLESTQKVTWDSIWFGSYPQREVVTDADSYDGVNKAYYDKETDVIEDEKLFQTLEKTPDSEWENNEVIVDGEKYRRMKYMDAILYDFADTGGYWWLNDRINEWHYFKYDPIKWRVLNVQDGQALLLADKSLDDQKYNTEQVSVTWETSSIRSWLNGYNAENNQPGEDYSVNNFLDTAFNDEQKKAIMTTDVKNSNNVKYNTEGGNDTKDKIFLLSEDETYNTDLATLYGFAHTNYEDKVKDEAKQCKSTTYAKARGTHSASDSEFAGNWWWSLRSPGKTSDCAAHITLEGAPNADSSYYFVMCNGGVRPALKINITSSDTWKFAGTVCSDGVTDKNALPGSGDNSYLLECEENCRVTVGEEGSFWFSYMYRKDITSDKSPEEYVTWSSKNSNIVEIEGKTINKAQRDIIFEDLTEKYSARMYYGKIKVKGISEGETQITGTLPDGTKRTCKVIVESKDKHSGEIGKGFLIGEKVEGNIKEAAKFFPSSWKMNSMIFPIEEELEVKENGESFLKISVGLSKDEWTEIDSQWDEYKKGIDSLFVDEKKHVEKNIKVEKEKGIKINLKNIPEPEFSAVGYFEGYFDKNGKLLPSSSGKVVPSVEWSVNKEWPFLTAVGPVYINLEGGINAEGSIRVAYNVDEKILEIDDGSLTITPSITIEGGYGISKVASVSAQGTAEVPISLIPATKANFKAKAQVNVQLVFVIDESDELGTIDCEIWNTIKNKKIRGLKTLQCYNNSLNEIDTSFAKDTSIWNPNKNNKKARDASKNAIETIQYAVLPSTLPLQAEIDGKRVMVFQAYDETRSTLNSTVLKYSVYENGSWSEPKAVYDNGCADFYADMKVVNGKLVLAWQKEKQKIVGDVSLDSNGVLQNIAGNSEIYFAEFNEKNNCFEHVTQITNNEECDMMPRICENSSNVVVSWVRNDENSLMQEKGINHIYVADWNGKSFEEERTLTTASGTIDDYVLYKDKNGVQTVFIGQSGGLNTVFDTDGNAMNQFLEILVDAEEGNIASLHYAEGMIGCVSNGKLYEYDIEKKKMKSYQAGKSAFGGQIKYCTNGTKAGYIWSTYDEDTQIGKIQASLKTEDGYSEPVTIAEGKNRIWRYFSPVMDQDGNWKITANALDSEKNRNILMDIKKQQDAKLKLAEASVNPGDIQNGLTGIEYVVVNEGDCKIKNAEAEIAFEDGSKVNQEVELNLEPGQEKEGKLYVDLSEITATQNAKITIAAQNQHDISQNSVQIKIGQPDVEIKASSKEQGEEIKITATLKNNSDNDAVTNLILYEDSEKTKELQKKAGINIKANETRTETFTLKKEEIHYNENDAAYLTLYAEVEGGDYNENNNTAYAIQYKPQQETKSDQIKDTNDEILPNVKVLAVGTVFSETSSQARYRVTKQGLVVNGKVIGAEAEYVRPLKKIKKCKIPNTVKAEQDTYKVVSVAKKAFKGNKKIQSVTIGKNVRKIGANAFYGCKNLRTIKIYSTQLKKKSVGKNVLKGIYKKAVIKVPAKKVKAYKNLFKGKGQAKSVTVKK